jgi:hypothetical protein
MLNELLLKSICSFLSVKTSETLGLSGLLAIFAALEMAIALHRFLLGKAGDRFETLAIRKIAGAGS